MLATLDRILAPASVDDLVSAMAGGRRLYVRTGRGADFGTLLSWATVNMLATMNRFSETQVRVLQASKSVPPAMYRDAGDRNRLRLDALQDLATQGASIAINGIHTLVPQVAAVARSAERHLRARTSVNTYLSFRERGAFRPHWDGHDVLVLHLHGRKRWRTYGVRAAYPTSSHVFASNEDPGNLEWEHVLEPGDVLYLPRGEVHAAEIEGDGACMHLTVAIEPALGSDVVTWMLQQAGDVIRMSVLARADEADLRAHESRLKAALHRAVDGIDLRTLLDATDRERQHVATANLAAAATLGPDTIVQNALRRPIVIPPPQAVGTTIRVGSITRRLSAQAAVLLDHLQRCEITTIREAGVALADRITDASVAAAELATAGLVYVDDDAASRQ